MGAFIAKQPNGLYCRFSTNVDHPTHWNMTEDEYVEICVERAKREAAEEAMDILKNYLYPFEEVKKRFSTNNMTQEEFDKFLQETSEPVKKVSEKTESVKENIEELFMFNHGLEGTTRRLEIIAQYKQAHAIPENWGVNICEVITWAKNNL